ncbi:DUF4412 domain-containing protein [Fluviicola chungangensis]|uniref:DUF4412 domain-containing protein n=1 Tax=Fluviicola chungangensis TaxID=2597671 RepID=A0A556MPT2_9FLAO|nr:DUF4412 domain-containing protein [Fluviicola chungangensis]TSJ41875.1 DUF4412 domain-containing protein [Fluviicola chungangensis]
MKALLLVLLVSCLSSMLFGQEGLVKSIGNTAKEKVNAQDFNTTRNNKERGNLMDEKKSKEAAPAPASAPAPGASEPAAPAETEPSGEYQASYNFTSSVTYKVESAKKPGESQSIHYNFGDQVIQMEAVGQDMSSIIDSKNGVMIMLNNKEKTAMVMSTKAMEAAMKQQQMNQGEKPAAKITKTGRTKMILGYRCEEILIESDKKTEVWITKDAGIDVSNTFANMNKTSPSQIPDEAFSDGGMLMEMNGYDAAGKVEMNMVVTALAKESKTVNIGAYKITRL